MGVDRGRPASGLPGHDRPALQPPQLPASLLTPLCSLPVAGPGAPADWVGTGVRDQLLPLVLSTCQPGGGELMGRGGERRHLLAPSPAPWGAAWVWSSRRIEQPQAGLRPQRKDSSRHSHGREGLVGRGPSWQKSEGSAQRLQERVRSWVRSTSRSGASVCIAVCRYPPHCPPGPPPSGWAS